MTEQSNAIMKNTRKGHYMYSKLFPLLSEVKKHGQGFFYWEVYPLTFDPIPFWHRLWCCGETENIRCVKMKQSLAVVAVVSCRCRHILYTVTGFWGIKQIFKNICLWPKNTYFMFVLTYFNMHPLFNYFSFLLIIIWFKFMLLCVHLLVPYPPAYLLLGICIYWLVIHTGLWLWLLHCCGGGCPGSREWEPPPLGFLLCLFQMCFCSHNCRCSSGVWCFLW